MVNTRLPTIRSGVVYAGISRSIDPQRHARTKLEKVKPRDRRFLVAFTFRLFLSFFFLSRGKSISFRRVELKPVRSIFKRCAIALGRNFEEINWKQRIFFFWREEREENEIIFKGDDFYRYVIDTRSRFFFSKGNVVNITGKTQFIILIFPISLYLERLICR